MRRKKGWAKAVRSPFNNSRQRGAVYLMPDGVPEEEAVGPINAFFIGKSNEE